LLGQAGHADQKGMATGQNSDQGEIDNALLTENDVCRGFTYLPDLVAGFLDAVDELGLGKCCHGFRFTRSWGGGLWA